MDSSHAGLDLWPAHCPGCSRTTPALSPPPRHEAPRPRTLCRCSAELAAGLGAEYMLPAYSRCQASSLAPQTRMEVLRMRKNPSQSAVENNVHGDARIRSCGANVAQAGDAGEKGRILTKYSVQAVPACSAQRNFGRKNVRPNRMEKIPRDFWLVGCQICDSELPSGVH